MTTEQLGQTPASQTKPAPTSADIVAAVHAVLDDMKAEDIVSIDLEGKSSIADMLIIASGRSNRQVASIAARLDDKLSAIGVDWLRSEGLPQADWVLIDAGDAIVHLFRPEVRAFYALEKMWGLETPVPKDLAEHTPELDLGDDSDDDGVDPLGEEE